MNSRLHDAVQASKVYFMASLNVTCRQDEWRLSSFRTYPLNLLLQRVIAHPQTHSAAAKIAIILRDPELIEYSRGKREQAIRDLFFNNTSVSHMLIVRLLFMNNLLHRGYILQIKQ